MSAACRAVLRSKTAVTSTEISPLPHKILHSQAFAGVPLGTEMCRVCGRSSSGRAPPCQGGGSEFEPRRPLQTNSKEPVYAGFLLIMVTWPSGKARVCKTLIRQFKSARHLHKTVMKKMSQSFLLYRRKLAISPTNF